MDTTQGGDSVLVLNRDTILSVSIHRVDAAHVAPSHVRLGRKVRKALKGLKDSVGLKETRVAQVPRGTRDIPALRGPRARPDPKGPGGRVDSKGNRENKANADARAR
jgi:hypothetical protein